MPVCNCPGFAPQTRIERFLRIDAVRISRSASLRRQRADRIIAVYSKNAIISSNELLFCQTAADLAAFSPIPNFFILYSRAL